MKTDPTPEPSFRRFRKEYDVFDYTDALVLDIGADYGCTPAFFLEKGARHVVACEKNPEWLPLLREWAQGKPVRVLGEVTPENVADLLDGGFDFVKVDCEGCESLLLTLPDDILSGPKGWVIETHTRELFEAFAARFDRLKYRVTCTIDFGEVQGSSKHCKILKAER